jgi:4-amino-4-deoxy-L-arabinose transferase-like glycosyltransferase
VIVPLAFFTLNRSKLPQYVLPLMPAFALAAACHIATGGVGAGARAYAGVAAVLGVALVALTRWLPAPIDLTPREQAAIPPTALALGIVVLSSAALVAFGAVRPRPPIAVLGYAMVVIAVPFASGGLLAAVGDDRSAAALARATAAALARVDDGPGGQRGPTAVLGVQAYPPSLPFYLGRTVAVATNTAAELTSNYIADYQEHYRLVTGSPLLPAGYWREALARCPVPTVFVTTAGNRDARAELAAALPLLTAGGRYVAYGPCLTPRDPPSPGRGERGREEG